MLRARKILAGAGVCLGLLAAPAGGQEPEGAQATVPVPPQAAGAGNEEAAAAGEARESPAARARARANDDLDRLRREIRLLSELHEAQKALLEWNGLRIETGEPAAVLDAEICTGMKEWCAALPATFGRRREDAR